MGESIFVPMKTLNEARHQALEELQEKLLEKYRRDKAEKNDRSGDEARRICQQYRKDRLQITFPMV